MKRKHNKHLISFFIEKNLQILEFHFSVSCETFKRNIQIKLKITWDINEKKKKNNYKIIQ